jgi:hypothetical protein
MTSDEKHIFELTCAVQLGDVATLRRLKQPTDSYSVPKRLLVIAASLDQAECVRELLTWGESAAKGGFVRVGLEEAARCGYLTSLQVFKEFIDKDTSGAEWWKVQRAGLLAAIEAKRMKAIRELLNWGTPVDPDLYAAARHFGVNRVLPRPEGPIPEYIPLNEDNV